MMEQQISIFEDARFGQIRTATTEGGEPLFCLADVCKALDLQTNKVKGRLSVRGWSTIPTPTHNQHGAVVEQEMTYITEPNLYKCIFQSRKATAEQFQEWVCSEVLPSIRRTGGYIESRMNESPEELMARALTVANETLQRQTAMLSDLEKKNLALTAANETLTERNGESERVIERLRPGAAFASAVAASDQSCLVGELAVILRQNGVDIGQNRLFEWMRKNGYLCSNASVGRYNQPTQKAMDMQLFEIKKTTIVKPDGDIIVKVTPKVTGKGQIYFVNKFLSSPSENAQPARTA